jgi:hypothetical protein
MPHSFSKGFGLLVRDNHDSEVVFADDATHASGAAVKSLADMMGAVLKQTGSAGALAPIWARVVGDVVGKHTRPIRWEGTRLVIRCDAEAWRAALESERESLTRKLCATLGESAVTSIVLEVG